MVLIKSTGESAFDYKNGRRLVQRDVGNNAEEAGLRSAFVELRYLEGGHAVIAFDTIDEGLVYFDAQTDERVRPVIGKRYYQCIEPEPGYYYTKPSYDDTIKDILVIW